MFEDRAFEKVISVKQGHMDGPYSDTIGFLLSRNLEDHVQTRGRSEVSEKTNPANTVTSDF